MITPDDPRGSCIACYCARNAPADAPRVLAPSVALATIRACIDMTPALLVDGLCDTHRASFDSKSAQLSADPDAQQAIRDAARYKAS